MSQRPSILPSAFAADWIARAGAERAAAPGAARALDVACGRGRHLIPLARAGFDTFGVDIRLDALADARDAVMSAGATPHLWCGDLTAYPLPASFFDLTVVVRYLQRDLFPPLAAALRPGGILIYETFTTEQLALGTGPRSPDHLLRLGELRNAFGTLSVEFYEEVAGPDALARLIARAP